MTTHILSEDGPPSRATEVTSVHRQKDILLGMYLPRTPQARHGAPCMGPRIFPAAHAAATAGTAQGQSSWRALGCTVSRAQPTNHTIHTQQTRATYAGEVPTQGHSSQDPNTQLTHKNKHKELRLRRKQRNQSAPRDRTLTKVRKQI